jgi:hypothetical protein
MASKIRHLFTDEQVQYAVDKAKREDGSIDYKTMSYQLSCNAHGTRVTPELCRYWARQFDTVKKNGDFYQTLMPANKAIKQERELRTPTPNDDLCEDEVISNNESVLIIPDLHSPYHHPDSLEFLVAVREQFLPDRVICLGDETDKHGLSFHDSDPNLDSAGMELEKSKAFLKKLAEEFPQVEVTHSNHGSLLYRKAKAHGIPVQYLKTYRQVLFPNGEGDGWSWHEHIKITLPNGDKVLFRHEPQGEVTGSAGHEGCNLVCGHLHGKFSITYAASSERLYWGMQAGCLIDKKSLAFAYGANFKSKPIIGCAVIYDSIPMLVPMRLDSRGRWIGKL